MEKKTLTYSHNLTSVSFMRKQGSIITNTDYISAKLFLKYPLTEQSLSLFVNF